MGGFAKCFACCVAVVTGFTAMRAHAQFLMLQPGTGPSASCYDGRKAPKPSSIAKAEARAERAFLDYRTLAKVPRGLGEIFLKHTYLGHGNWALDGTFIDAADATDPWVNRTARVERTSLTVANGGSYLYRAIWNAYAADGMLLGSYDAMLQSGRGSAGFITMELRAPGMMAKALPVVPFCSRPGDIERWKNNRK
ncbi:hypothetical protein [Sphingomonas leidyi]|uniref:hypothetical protein n=1 Tax=Sphingomonas leidyi TaxID=68569 RepID=UPI0014212727|nr:hypothetical protein [Sphingomonas leidyi]